MESIDSLNLKVVVVDSDYYALQSINGYLAWDRRTRVTCLATSLEQMWVYIAHIPRAEYPDVIVIDADHAGGANQLRQTIQALNLKLPNIIVVCLAQFVNPELVEATAEAGGRAFMLKHEVRLHIAWAICYAVGHEFVISPEIAKACTDSNNPRIYQATVLPDQRTYPEMTDRIKQAIMLCVIEGLPAHVAADEMGISLHTIRGYIKDGYRILETYDETEYPVDMTPQERAFMRFTALEM